MKKKSKPKKPKLTKPVVHFPGGFDVTCPHALLCTALRPIRATVDNIEIQLAHEADPDTSMLDNEQKSRYYKGELESYRVRARVQVNLPRGNDGLSFDHFNLFSPGIWGVWCMGERGDRDYLMEVARDELLEVQFYLEILNVDLANWGSKIERSLAEDPGVWET